MLSRLLYKNYFLGYSRTTIFKMTTGRPYSNCNTRIIDLRDLNLPEDATEEQYNQIYEDYIQSSNKNAQTLRDAVQSIKYGVAPPVAFPTETVYGLGADATNGPAVSGIFAAKGRPMDNPLIVHAASASQVEKFTGESIPEIYKSLIEKFWPGPLTILIPTPKSSKFAKNVHPGQSTIGFRVPQSKFARFFISITDRPIAGPSANSSGKPSPTTAQHVMDDLKGKINFILDGGPCDVGVESTVVDGLHDPPLILRPGGVSQKELILHGKEYKNQWINTTIGYKIHTEHINGIEEEENDESPEKDDKDDEYQNLNNNNDAPRAPGMKYRHYSPEGRLILFSQKAITSGKPKVYLENHILHQQPQFQTRSCHLGIIITNYKWNDLLFIQQKQQQQTQKLDEEDDYQKIILNSIYKNQISTTNFFTEKTGIKCKIFNVDVGSDINILAQSLFGILRLFDDLKCDLIFAEIIISKNQKSNDNHDEHNNKDIVLDAVIDRLEKAASERI